MGALAAVYVSYGLAMGLAFVVFVVARQLAAAAFGARGGLAPFGEPPSAAFAQARRGARLAVTVAGPLALYVVATLLVAIGWLFAGPGQPSTRLHAAVPGMPAAKAGLLAEDRIVALDGERVSNPEEVRSFMHRDGREAVAVTVRRARRGA